MILYRLACDCGHEYETWFQNSQAFDSLAATGRLACPACGGSRVQKAVMAPRIAKRAVAPVSMDCDRSGKADHPAIPAETVHSGLLDAVRKLRKEVEEKADYVGPRFADEARKIDSGEAPDRGIYGEATPGEVRALVEDGIAILPLPRLPEESN